MKIFEFDTKNLRKDFPSSLLSEWLRAYNIEGLFKYRLDEQTPTKYVDGKYSFIIQKNSKRYTEKRLSEIKKSTSISIDFDPSKFNFTKIKSEEILLKLVDLEDNEENDNFIIVNNSPIDICHCLICPKINKAKNQVLDSYSIKLACQILDLIQSDRFLIGFNSIGAYASVNNLHLHFYEIRESDNFRLKQKYIFPIQNVKKAKLVKNNLFFLDFECYYRPCFCLELNDYDSIESFSSNLFLITDYLNKNDIPHNVVFVKSDSFRDSRQTTKSFIWPKIHSQDIPVNEKNLCFAITEMSGHFIAPFDCDYDMINEEFIIDVAQYVQPKYDEILKIKDELFKIF